MHVGRRNLQPFILMLTGDFVQFHCYCILVVGYLILGLKVALVHRALLLTRSVWCVNFPCLTISFLYAQDKYVESVWCISSYFRKLCTWIFLWNALVLLCDLIEILDIDRIQLHAALLPDFISLLAGQCLISKIN